MSVALGVTAAIALIAIVALVVTVRTTAGRLAAERSRTEDLDGRLAHALSAAAEAQHQAEAARHDRDLAVTRAEAADQQRAAADQQLAAASGGLVAAAPLWDLERQRLQREWTELVGPSVPLPLPWDGSLSAFIGVQLEIIREQIGTPSQLEPSKAAWTTEPATAVPAARLATELLRRLAMEGEEITVTFGEDEEISVAIATEGPTSGPDLSGLGATAAALGGHLALHHGAGELRAQLRLKATGELEP
jgi:hypothetical protein